MRVWLASILCFGIFFNAWALHNNITIVSIGKNGTYLAKKCFDLLTPKGFGPFDRNPHPIPTPQNIDFFKKNEVKVIFIQRDPRDRLVSLAFAIQKRFMPETSIETIISELINNYGKFIYENTTKPSLYLSWPNLLSIYDCYMGWMQYPDLYITHFEKLIGPQGGGTQEDQINEIIMIGRSMGLTISRDYAEKVGAELYGSTPTFRKGKIGAWKKYFTPQHKNDFKKITGSLVVDLGYATNNDW